ncbi:MAG: sigma-70 family RNA polymerase sigma factor [Planctomycetes bacterium]|nr:sigma-70 family RNA polymerase sigma factor [Planctomycetota bacterium]
MTPEETLRQNGWVRRLARALVRDAARADDVVQEATVAAWRAGGGANAAASPPIGWWRGAIRQLAALEWRRAARSARRERVAARAEALPATVDVAAQFERHCEVVEALGALAEPDREVLLLRFYEGLPPRAVAARLGLPVRTVESRIVRALEKLRAALIGGSRERRRALAAWAFAGGGVVGVKSGGMALVAAGALLLAGLATWRLWPSTAHEPARTLVAAAGAPASPPLDGAALPADLATRAAEPAPSLPPPPSAARATSAAAIRGQVLWHDAPFAGATVALFRREGQEGTSNDWEELAREEPIASATSDADGRFAFAHEPAGATFLRATARADRRSAAIVAVAGAELLVRLTAAATLRGSVVRAEDGAPVEDASVTVTNVDTLRDVVTTRTDAGGRYAFESLDPGRWRASVVSIDGTATTPRNLACSAPDSRFRLLAGEPCVADFEVGGGLTLSGRVTDAATGEPIAGARLSLPHFAPSVGSGPVTAADGSYRWSGLRLRGLQTVAATAPGYGTATRGLRGQASGATSSPSSSTKLDFALARAGRVLGRVVDADGQPLANAQLRTAAAPPPRPATRSSAAIGGGGTLLGAFDVEERSTRSDAEGTFELAGLSVDRVHWLRVRALDHADALFVLPALEADVPVVLPDLALPPAAELLGTIRSADGVPLAAVLELVPSAESVVGFREPLPPRPDLIDAWLATRSATTAADGSFRVDRLGGGRWTLRIGCEGAVESPPARMIEIPSGGGAVTLPPIVLDAGLPIGGRLVSTDGSPVGGTAITVAAAAGGASRLHATVAAADGRFVVHGLSAGAYSVRVGSLESLGSRESEESAVLFTAVEPVAAGRADLLVPVEVGRWIDGVARHADGRATGSLAVRASWSEAQLGPETRSDDWGRFQLLVPRRGSLRIAVCSAPSLDASRSEQVLANVVIEELADLGGEPIELLLPE